MNIRKMALVAAIGLTMASAPVLAQSSAPISRAGAQLIDANAQDDDDDSGASTYIIAFFVILAIGLGIYTATDDGEDGRTSP